MSNKLDNTMIIRRNPKAAIEQLRAEANKNATVRDICFLWASRERARNQVTVGALRLAMAREGFIYDRKDYEKALRFFASLGLGKLDTDSKGTVRMLKDITVTLQSIGRAVAAPEAAQTFEKFAQATPYTNLPIPQVEKPITPPQPTKPYAACLVVTVNKQEVIFDIPKGLTESQLGSLLAEFYGEGTNH